MLYLSIYHCVLYKTETYFLKIFRNVFLLLLKDHLIQKTHEILPVQLIFSKTAERKKTLKI